MEHHQAFGRGTQAPASKDNNNSKQEPTTTQDLDDRFLYPNGSRKMSIYGPKFLYGPRRGRHEQDESESAMEKDEAIESIEQEEDVEPTPCSSSSLKSEKTAVSSDTNEGNNGTEDCWHAEDNTSHHKC